ncbi:MAG: aldo/keto reductase [Candidatus Bathyarchaeota archaeon]|nr:aldo/keto reductase [Candidatus Bathyarchaeota archaeon]
MEKIRLGKSGLNVTRVVMGGIPIQRPSMDDAKKVINRALDLGINLIDTSIGYGDSEIRIGEAVKDRRDEVYLATKGRWQSKEIVKESIDASLKRLQTDYIDLWQMHNIRDPEAFQQVIAPGGSMEAAKEALESGKIHHLGFSTHHEGVAMMGVESGLFETVQFPFNFIAREANNRLIQCAKDNDVGFIGMKPFAGGNITDARLAIGYVLQFDNVVPDPGIERAEEIEQIVELVESGIELQQEDQDLMDKIKEELGNRFCRQCMYCMPCPQGVEIWLLTYMKNLFRLWPKQKVIDVFGDRANTAELCIQCGECETRCPYDLPIRELIQENYEYYNEMAKNQG